MSSKKAPGPQAASWLAAPLLTRLSRRRGVVSLAVLIVSGAAAAAISQTIDRPLAALGWGLVPFLLSALAYSVLEAAGGLDVQASAQAATERQLSTLAESNAALKAAHREVVQQKALAENLLAVARATGQQPVLEGTLQNALDITATLTGATQGSLYLLDPSGRISQHLITRQPAPQPAGGSRVGQLLEDGLAGWAVRNRQVACDNDTHIDPRWMDLPGQSETVRSAIAVPFISRGAVIGVLVLAHLEPNHFSEAHEKLLSSAADQIAIALDNAKMFNTMMRMADHMGLLYALSDIATQADLDKGLARSLNAIQRATRWPGLAVLLLDELGSAVVVRTQLGDKLPQRLGLDDTLVRDAWQSCESVEVDSTTWGRLLVAPICTAEHALGVLLVRGSAGEAFNAEDVELASSAADTLATAIVISELRCKVEQLSQCAGRAQG